MSDYPVNDFFGPNGFVNCYSQGAALRNWPLNASGSGVWPAANRAFYIPFVTNQIVTAYKMATIVATQAGNLDMGIYNEQGVRLVSTGSTAVGAAGIQIVDITDTVLTPGVYYLAMSCSSSTASFTRSNPSTLASRSLGIRQQTTAIPLPANATFVAVSSNYNPIFGISLNQVI